MKAPFFIFGMGGHAKCVIEAATASGMKPDGIIDDAPRASDIYGIPVFAAAEFPLYVPFRFVVAIGDCAVRERIFNRLIDAGGTPQTVIHPRAYVSPSAKIGEGTMVMHFATADCDTITGDNCILNIGCILGHDVRVGNHVHISGGVTLCGGSKVDDGAWVGAGSSVRQNLRVGRGAFVGLNSTVTKPVDDGATVFNPGGSARARFISESVH